MSEANETRSTPGKDDDADTTDVVIALAKNACGYFIYDRSIERTGEGVEVVIRERYVRPDPRAARLLKQKGIKYAMIRAEQE